MKTILLLLFLHGVAGCAQTKHTTAEYNIQKFVAEYFVKENVVLGPDNPPGYVYINADDFAKLSSDDKSIFKEYINLLFPLFHSIENLNG